MAGLGIGLFFGGYSLLYYGLSQVMGANYGFLDVIVPHLWAKAEKNPPPKDKPGASGASQVMGNSLQDLQKAADKIKSDANPKTNPVTGSSSAVSP